MATKHHILALGGTGLCGQIFTRAALDAGHKLTLYVRTPSKLPSDLAEHANLEVLQGTYDSVDGLSRAAACGADVFISLAGPTLGRREGTPVTNALRLLYPLLLNANPRIRILVLSTASYSAPQDRRSIKWFFAINGYVRVIGGDSYTEIRGIAEATVGLGDDVEWTVFRVPLLSGKTLKDGAVATAEAVTMYDGQGDPAGTAEVDDSKSKHEAPVEPGTRTSVSHGGNKAENHPDSDDGQSRNDANAGVHAGFVGNKMGWDGLFLDRGRLVMWILGELGEKRWLRLCPILANA